MKRFRHLKTICQHIFVEDDGETLVERAADPVAVSAAEWPAYATERFAAEFERLQRQAESE